MEQQIQLCEVAQDDLDRLFREGRHASGETSAPLPQREYRDGENRAARRARERAEKRSKYKVAV